MKPEQIKVKREEIVENEVKEARGRRKGLAGVVGIDVRRGRKAHLVDRDVVDHLLAKVLAHLRRLRDLAGHDGLHTRLEALQESEGARGGGPYRHVLGEGGHGVGALDLGHTRGRAQLGGG